MDGDSAGRFSLQRGKRGKKLDDNEHEKPTVKRGFRLFKPL
ncbi:hypothetical protein [Thalassorhabdus alkalitolerans]